MEYAQLLAYAIQGIRLALTAVAAGSHAHAVLSHTDEQLAAMQADGNRAPTQAERDELAALLDNLAAKPTQA